MPSMIITASKDVEKDSRKKMMAMGSKIMAEEIGKPESYCLVSFQTADMIFGGSDEPCAFVRVVSLGGLNQAVNKAICERVVAMMDEFCGIPKNRFCS